MSIAAGASLVGERILRSPSATGHWSLGLTSTAASNTAAPR